MNWSCHYLKHEKRLEPVEWPQNCHGKASCNGIKLWKKGFREISLSCLTWTQWFPSYRISWIWAVYTAQWLQSWWEGFVHRLKGLLQAFLLERWQLCVWAWHTGEFLAQLCFIPSLSYSCVLGCSVLLQMSPCDVVSYSLYKSTYTCIWSLVSQGFSSLQPPSWGKASASPQSW